MWRRLFSQFSSQHSRRTVRRRANPHRFSGRRPARFGAERLEARWYLSGDPIVQVNTNGYGSFQIELRPDVAPQTVANFLSYVDSGKYNNLVVSRSLPGFIVQAGGITSATSQYTSNSQFVGVPQSPTIPLEYNLPDTVGTIAMARRSQQPSSAASEWFINLGDNSQGLGPNGSDKPYGYAVFGQVIGNGMQVVNSIAAVPTKNEGSVQTGPSSSTDLNNLPVTASNQLVQITSMTLLDGVYGTVFADANSNGTQDTGESGVAGRTVFVDVDGTGKPDSTNPSATTDANGNYYIAAVPAGSFKVKEVLPSGATSTTTLQTVTFAASTAATKVNFGENIPSISGTVFVDINGDGKLDNGEPGVAARTVFLNNDGSGQPGTNNPSTTTDANGNFSFSGLAAKTYKVAEVLPANVALSTNTQSIAVTAGQTATANLGELPSIIGTVFQDLNVNGKLDAGEPGLPGVTVFLNNDNTGKLNNNPKTTTDAAGHFFFTGLASGSYNVMQVVTANHGVTQTTSTSAVTVGSSPLPNVTIGDVLTSPIVPLPVNINTQTPPTNANAAYIDDLYFTLLGRHADSKSLSDWQQKMSSGTTRTEVAQTLWDSPEHRKLEVNQLYQTYLNRAAEPDGLSFWMTKFAGGNLTERLAVSFFLSSPEYQAAHNADSDYISAVYQDALSRAAGPSDLSYWQTAMSKGQTRDQVAVSIVNGAEAATNIIDAYYANFLHRVAGSGAQDLINTLAAGKTTAEGAGVGILATDEYFALAGSGK